MSDNEELVRLAQEIASVTGLNPQEAVDDFLQRLEKIRADKAIGIGCQRGIVLPKPPRRRLFECRARYMARVMDIWIEFFSGRDDDKR
jgi:hypothetical protein